MIFNQILHPNLLIKPQMTKDLNLIDIFNLENNPSGFR